MQLFGYGQNKTADVEKEQQFIVGLDIGTSKVCAIVAAPSEQAGKLNILGIGITESEGLNRGVVVNIDKTVGTIQKVIEIAEQQSGIKINEVVVGIAGDHIESFQTRGIVGISNPSKEISYKDVERVIEESRNIKIPAERKILHVIPQEYIIDGQDGISDPVGMSGVRMEANVHIVTGMSTAVQNIYRCVEKLGIRVKEVVLEPIASSCSVLDEEEREVGVALIDIGGGTTDIAIFEGNIIRFTSVLGIAGKQVTDDVRKGLGIIMSEAERIKREYGHTYLRSILDDEVIMIRGIHGRKPIEINKSFLCQIIQPRMEEIFEFAQAEIRRSAYSGSLGAGIVITGGCSLLRGVEELAQDIFGMPVKVGVPAGISHSGLVQEVESPIYSTAVGLVQYGMQHSRMNNNLKDEKKIKDDFTVKDKPSVFNRMKKFMEDL